MSEDTHYKDAHPRSKALMEAAAPPCSRNAPGATTLKVEIVALHDRQTKIVAQTKKKQDKLNEICKHPTTKRMVRSWTTFDTLGNMDGGYDDVYCTVCGQQLDSQRTRM